jgi:hypothetical protein
MDEIERIRERAARWRALAIRTTDAKAIEALHHLAREAEDEIARLRGEGAENEGLIEASRAAPRASQNEG